MVFRASYNVERSLAGLVLGKKGKGLQPLKEMPGVHSIFFDRKSSVCTLRVTGVRQEYCDAVYQEVMRRINNYLASSQTSRFLIDVEDKSLDTAVLVPCEDHKINSVVLGEGDKEYEEYRVSTFIRGSPCNGFDFSINETSSHGSSFMEFNHSNIVASFRDALDVYEATSPNHRLYFHASLGKLTFTVPRGNKERYLDRNELTGSKGREYLTGKSISTFFNPNIGSHYLALINKKLALFDFTYVENDHSGNVVVNLDERKPGWTNCSIELSKHENENTKSKNDRPKLSKIVKHRKRLRTLTTMCAKEMDVGVSLTSYDEKKTELSEGECKAFQLCWDNWEDIDELLPGVVDDKMESKVSVTCLKQVTESYTWVKEAPFSHGGEDTAELTVRIKKLKKKSRKFGLRDNCLELNLFFPHDRSNVSAEGLAAEMLELRKWVERMVQ